MSLTIVIPNRNRELVTVKRSLDSLAPQLNEHTSVTVVDYGSELSYQRKLQELLNNYTGFSLILCLTQGQLWNKSRCINMVLKTCDTSHFMVCDMDMLWHPEFLEKQFANLPKDHAVYFNVGIMTQQESALQKSFDDYSVKFQTNEEATGISLFPTAMLQSINGFDEFYHGWGSEDTDVHVRLKNAGHEVRFCESELFFKHQWHKKAYRTVSSGYPYHTKQERVNMEYLKQVVLSKRILANFRFEKGLYINNEVKTPQINIQTYAFQEAVVAALSTMLEYPNSYVLTIHAKKPTHLKQRVKHLLKGNRDTPLNIKLVNDLVLSWIINNARNCSYRYSMNNKTIVLYMVTE
jgi:glycosyltransferase involved in cell wall biosynthesis